MKLFVYTADRSPYYFIWDRDGASDWVFRDIEYRRNDSEIQTLTFFCSQPDFETTSPLGTSMNGLRRSSEASGIVNLWTAIDCADEPVCLPATFAGLSRIS
jgi:hypothetical protein